MVHGAHVELTPERIVHLGAGQTFEGSASGQQPLRAITLIYIRLIKLELTAHKEDPSSIELVLR